ncbi:MAG TPA: hypothetical protein DDZ88_17735 [Verrucomicrobiales bacterium]|nr:hypothetical protein [Verrucomicrobiales bacterium]
MLDDPVSPIKRGIKTHEFNPLNAQKRGLPWGAMAAAAMVLLGIGGWMFMAGDKPDATAATSVKAPVTEPPVAPPEPASTKSIAEVKKETPAKKVPAPPAEVASKKPEPAALPVVNPPPPVAAKSTDAKVAAKPVEMAVAPPSAPEKVEKPAAAAPEKAPAANPPPPKDPITIRRAIVPTKEEIERMKQGHVENSTGRLPTVSAASPLPSTNNKKP